MKIAFIRTNFFWFNQQTGGSVGHIAGFTNGINRLNQQLFFVSTDRLVKIDEKRNPIRVIEPSSCMKRVPYLGELAYNVLFWLRSRPILRQERPDWLYHRSSSLSIAGALAKKIWRKPLIIEYNSPEGWKLRHWTNTTPVKQMINRLIARLMDWTENYNLRQADLIVVVSTALVARLKTLGISQRKILVNPNGVDIEELDGVKPKKLAQNQIHIGMTSTFAHWHGAQVLAEAIAPVVRAHPNAHFILIGDGVYKSLCEQIVRDNNVTNFVTFTGTLSHHDSLAYTKACQILVSPHVPNVDGSPFFGSPTKLFEYMAAGRCIVASDLDQVGEIIREYQAGILVEPGDAEDLVRGLNRALSSPSLREKLGRQARQAAAQNFTWTSNAQRVLDRALKIKRVN